MKKINILIFVFISIFIFITADNKNYLSAKDRQKSIIIFDIKNSSLIEAEKCKLFCDKLKNELNKYEQLYALNFSETDYFSKRSDSLLLNFFDIDSIVELGKKIMADHFIRAYVNQYKNELFINLYLISTLSDTNLSPRIKILLEGKENKYIINGVLKARDGILRYLLPEKQLNKKHKVWWTRTAIIMEAAIIALIFYPRKKDTIHYRLPDPPKFP